MNYEPMDLNQAKFDEAVNDFLIGNGKGLPDHKHCEILIHHHEVINKLITDAFNKKLKVIYIIPYGDSILLLENTILRGYYTTNMLIETEEHKMNIYFVRN